VIFVIRHQQLESADIGELSVVCVDVDEIDEIRADAGAGEDADVMRVTRRVVSCVFEGLPCAFQKQTVLRVVSGSIDSTPSRKLRQNASRFCALGKRPAIPIIAISESAVKSGAAFSII
jgi:hypothetical protein